MSHDQSSARVFTAASTLLLAASAAVTIAWCTSMTATGGMAMPGAWTMSMAWMRMPGRSWPTTAFLFVSMWLVMMIAMMLPSLAPVLWRYRQAAASSSASRPDRLALVGGLGYFAVWTAIGLAVFAIGAVLATLEMRRAALAQAVPIAAGIVVVMAGAVQFTAWKQRHLACWRAGSGQEGTGFGGGSAAFGYGMRLGVRCLHCCGNLMVILLVGGVMDLRVMAALTAAISIERLAPAGGRAARATGAVAVAAGLILAGRAAGLG